MTPDELPQDTIGQVPDNPHPLPAKTSFWKKHLVPISLATIILVVAAGIVVALAFGNNKTKTPVSHSVSAAVNTPASSTSSQSASTSTNTWKGTVSATALPLGDGKVSTTPQVGYVDSCTANFKGAGARHAGSWINDANSTWNSVAKPAVEGSVSWPNASNSITTNATSRIIYTNDLPKGYPTGNFPIARTDPAYQYDTNPNHIAAQDTTYTLPLNPVAAASPGCLGLGPIGVMTDGVFLYNALDAAGRDAGAHEIQDLCNGHPDGSDRYHYHSLSSCLLKNATGSSTLVGYALDGYGIYVERDSSGNLPTNADLDACHGRTSSVMWNGKLTSIYHYDATLEYPYTVGCYHGTPVSSRG